MQRKIILSLIAVMACLSMARAEDFTFDDYEDTLYIDFVESIEDNHLKVDFVVESFEDILSMQYTIKHSDGIVFDSVTDGGLSDIAQSINKVSSNLLAFLWVNITSLEPVTLPDSSIIFTLHFTITEGNEANIEIVSNPTRIEIVNGMEELVVLVTNKMNILFSGNFVTGYLFGDFNNDCTKNEGDFTLSDWIISIENEDEFTTYSVTDEDGKFRRYLEPGTYTIYPKIKNNLWLPCVESYDVTIDENSGLTEIDFGLIPAAPCTAPRISVESIFLRRCFDNVFFIQYCNDGTEGMNQSMIELNYDPRLILVTEDAPVMESDAGYLKLAGGSLGIGSCKQMQLVFNLDCETVTLGETHCMEAKISPVEDCTTVEGWSGASLKVTGQCNEENVEFIIENIGDGPMAETRSFIVIEDDVMLPQFDDDYDLGPGDTIMRSFPANGATYRLIADQEVNHPFSTKITAAVEGCGTNNENTFSKGYVTQFAAYDDEPYIDVYCRENIGAYDPNDKQGFPKGYGEEGLIYNYNSLDYLIRFQNTGTDTAFNIVIKDEIAEELDLSTIEVGPSSHSYRWNIENDRTLVFTFEDILLPDSTTNLQGSNGFIKYKIGQTAGNVLGEQINNEADIFFDFNEPIRTNLTKHTIGADFVISVIKNNDGTLSEQFKIYPNPVSEGFWIENEMFGDEFNLKIFSSDGKVIFNRNLKDPINYIERSELKPGINLFKISTQQGKIFTGKIVLINIR